MFAIRTYKINFCFSAKSLDAIFEFNGLVFCFGCGVCFCCAIRRVLGSSRICVFYGIREARRETNPPEAPSAPIKNKSEERERAGDGFSRF